MRKKKFAKGVIACIAAALFVAMTGTLEDLSSQYLYTCTAGIAFYACSLAYTSIDRKED